MLEDNPKDKKKVKIVEKECYSVRPFIGREFYPIVAIPDCICCLVTWLSLETLPAPCWLQEPVVLFTAPWRHLVGNFYKRHGIPKRFNMWSVEDT